MLKGERINELKRLPRTIRIAEPGDPDLDVLQLLPGKWKNTKKLLGRGYNMIALPFASSDFPFNYRLMINQYDEVLNFTIVDKGVKNRGISREGGIFNADQVVIALDYEQHIKQSAADDFPNSGLAGGPGLDIHHEPGLWLFMTNETDKRSSWPVWCPSRMVTRFWRSEPDGAIDRQLVLRMTAPEDWIDVIRRVVNSIRDNAGF